MPDRPQQLPSHRRFAPATAAVAALGLALTGAALLPPAPAAARQPAAGAPEGSGLPLPRFASLAGERINVRTGPGKQYPIRWIYARRDLPVRIVAEFDTWRKIEDHEGDQGWVHVSLLSSRRTALVRGGVRDLHGRPDPAAPVVLRAEPGVIGRLVGCGDGGAAWCEVELEGRRAWLQRAGLWGAPEGEPAP